MSDGRPDTGTERDELRTITREPFRFVLPGSEIRGDAWLPEEPVPDVAIVVCHGFKGFKDWGFFPYVACELAARTGCLTVSFNFDGSGVRDSTDVFDDLDSFATNTFSRELVDLEGVLDRLARGRLGSLDVPAASAFGLLGHSRGGATCVLKTGVRTQVRALVTWAAVCSVGMYEDLFATQLDAGEPVHIPNARTGQQMPMYRNVLDDIGANRERLDVLAAAATLAVPYLIVHGSEDESVPASHARGLAEAAPDSRLEIIEGAGHTFGAGHPFEGPNPDLERAVDLTAAHFRAVFDRS